MQTTTFKYADINELNFGISMDELCAAEGLAIYVSENRFKESMIKSEAEFAEIIGIEIKTDADLDCVHYAVNVCKRLFPHHVNYK